MLKLGLTPTDLIQKPKEAFAKLNDINLSEELREKRFRNHVETVHSNLHDLKQTVARIKQKN